MLGFGQKYYWSATVSAIVMKNILIYYMLS